MARFEPSLWSEVSILNCRVKRPRLDRYLNEVGGAGDASAWVRSGSGGLFPQLRRRCTSNRGSQYNYRKQAFTVRREKALVHSGRKDPPGNWIAPPGSNRSGGGGNKAVEASGVEGRIRRLGESVGRNVSER